MLIFTLLTALIVSSSSTNGALFAPKINVTPWIKTILGYTQDSRLDFHELVRKYGYRSEEYNVTTSDGYILDLLRLNSGKCDEFVGSPVVLMHGAFQSAECWVDAGPGAGLAYLLADACRDVWLGNNRGTSRGRRHATLDPDADAAFWDYANDEMGHYDVPAIIDRILQLTNAENVDYIGFSQGGTIAMIAALDFPEYTNKINSILALAPAIRLLNTASLPLRLVFQGVTILRNLLESFGIYELFYKESFIQVAFEYICQNTAYSGICYSFFALTDGVHANSYSNYTIQRVYSNFPNAVSVKQMVKYNQVIESGDFPKYDYGADKNLEVYGSETAPLYDLMALKVPTVLVIGAADNMVALKDLEWAAERIPNSVLEVVDADVAFNHWDNTYHQNISSTLLPIIMKHLEN